MKCKRKLKTSCKVLLGSFKAGPHAHSTGRHVLEGPRPQGLGLTVGDGTLTQTGVLPTEPPALRRRRQGRGTFFGVDTLEWSELTLCLEAGLLGTCCGSGRGRPSTSARMHSWYSWDFRKRV